MTSTIVRVLRWAASCGLALVIFVATAQAMPQQAEPHAWDDKSLTPDARAELVLKELTLDEKIGLLHGQGMRGMGQAEAERLHVQRRRGMGAGRAAAGNSYDSDERRGVRRAFERRNGRYSTALPSNVASASSWDPDAACEYGALIGRELRAQGYNMTLGGGVNITREPRNGRTFEYMGEDPMLAGTLVGNRIKCEQAQHVIGDIKHYAMNDQESGRNEVDVHIDKRSMQESDLLAFHIGLRDRQSRGGDVFVQRDQRRLRLPERVPADGCAEEGLEFPGLCGFGLGRDAQHGEGFSCGARQRAAGRALLSATR